MIRSDIKIKDELTQYFQPRENFSRAELYDFYRRFDPDLKASTLGWRIHELKKRNIIKTVKKGFYSISDKYSFIPEINSRIRKINNSLKDNFSNVSYNLWSTEWLIGFTLHQPMGHIIVVETERDSMESMFFYLKYKSFKNVFLKPDANLVEKYISEEKEAIVIKPMISRAPIRKTENIPLSTLEKILVDLFCDEGLFVTFRGNELVNIFDHTFKYYTVNFSRLFNYAKRRKREKPLREFFAKHFAFALKHLD